ncbi:hypothetical protein AB0869_16795 [Micromonospora vinacea]|uniref:DUF4760 domain-containing protein n=1 Tax=Micromonospora vinacea TaxID=709878 RepID=UPI00345559C1
MTAQISAVVAIVAALISCVQLLVGRSVSRGGILSGAMTNHWSAENVALRDVVYGLENKDYAQWSEEERAAATAVGIQISQIGFLLRNSYADRRAFLDFWSNWCVRLFVILSPMIADLRLRQNSPDQWIYFEWLARKAYRHTSRRPWWQRHAWASLKRQTRQLPDPDALRSAAHPRTSATDENSTARPEAGERG